MSNQTNFQLINRLTKFIDTESLQINMSDSIYFTVKTSRELDFNNIFEIAKTMEKITGEEVEFIEKREDNIMVFRCIHPKRKEIEYEANSEAVRQRKIPELTETATLEPPKKQNVTKHVIEYGIIIIMTIAGTLAVSYLLKNIVTFDIFFNTIMFALLIIMIGIGTIVRMIY